MTAAAFATDHLEAEAFGAIGGQPLAIIDLREPGADALAVERSRAGSVVVGIDPAAALPVVDPEAFDCLLTVAAHAPAPWLEVADLQPNIDAIGASVVRAPVAAATLCRVLRINERLSVRDGLAVESLAYSTLLGGGEFRHYLATRRVAPPVCAVRPPLHVDRQADTLTISLASPASRNAIDATMRDALWEALAAALDDPSRPAVLLRGMGACFSTGGELGEFGTSSDLAYAHAVRTARSCAALLIELGDRATVALHGACIGSGIEIAAAASRRWARDKTFFQLPELAMGLIPGAGGTVTIPNRIGRHRTAWMVLSGRRLPVARARSWGLVAAGPV